MLPRRAQSGRRTARPSLFGDGLLERIRSISLALLGLTTVLGLGLIAFVLQLGWSVAPNLPIPGAPGHEHGAISGQVMVAEPDRTVPGAERSDATRVAPSPKPTGSGAVPAESRLGAAKRLAVPVENPVTPAPEQPAGGDEAPGSAPPPQTAPVVAAPTPTTVASPAPNPSGSAPPVPATANVPAKDEPKNWGRSRSSGKSSWGDRDDGNRRSDGSSGSRGHGARGGGDSEYEPPASPPTPQGEAPASTPPSPEGYGEDDSEDDDDSPGWGGRGHGHRH